MTIILFFFLADLIVLYLPLDLVSTVQIENTKINNFIIYKLNSVSGVSSFSFKCAHHICTRQAHLVPHSNSTLSNVLLRTCDVHTIFLKFRPQPLLYSHAHLLISASHRHIRAHIGELKNKIK